MRELTSHKVGGLNEQLRIEVLDEPGASGACHVYAISGPASMDETIEPIRQTIAFQRGPIREHGVNGISNEALLAIVEDRLSAFQAGAFACQENQFALNFLRESLWWLKNRTAKAIRVRRERFRAGLPG